MNEHPAVNSRHRAYQDLWSRTLARISGDLNRLIYLASLRDYNSGRYHHAGLETQFGLDAAHHALGRAHRELFAKLSLAALEQLVAELELYMQGAQDAPDDIFNAWRTLQPYRVAVPLEVDPVAAHLLCSNLKLSLEVLRNRRICLLDHR